MCDHKTNNPLRFLLWIPILCLMFLDSHGQKRTSDNEGTIWVVGRKLKKPSGGLYLIRIGKDTTYTLLDETKIIPEDLKFLDFSRIAYNGNRILHLKYQGKKFEISRVELENSRAEGFYSLVLMDSKFLVVDSLDRSYLSGPSLKSDQFDLLVYDSLLRSKVGSIRISDKNVRVKKYSNSTKGPRYVFYPDYTPKNIDAPNWVVTLKILDLQNRKLFAFDSVYASIDSHHDVLYFNPRYVRDEGNGKLTYLKVLKGKTDKLISLKILEWDYVNSRMKVKWDISLENPFKDNYRHRIKNDFLFVGDDEGIWRIDKRGNRKTIFESSQFKILDFYIF